jgi:acetoin:2,6-dichlorophenolindophenol oxidoreductase subunit alpha
MTMLSQELQLRMYRLMVFGRLFEQRAEQVANRGLVPGSIHLGIGEEAANVGPALALAPEDYILPSHRGHVAAIAKGADPGRIMAEMMGRATGFGGGRAGSCHLADAGSNNLGVQGIIGAVFPVAAGAALTQKRLGTGRVVLAWFGDGAAHEGTFHEALNLSSIWKLPVIWVCVNNEYAMGTSFASTTAVKNIADQACAYAMPGLALDGNDVVAAYEAVCEARERALSGAGPTLVELKTYRHRGHSTFDRNTYRPQEEIERWMARDPIRSFERTLRAQGILDDGLVTEIAAEMERRMDEAEAFAVNSPNPAPESAMELVLCQSEVQA